MTGQALEKAVGVAVRVGAYGLSAVIGLVMFAFLVAPWGYLVASALSVFLAAAAANFLAMRIFERAQLADIGLGWTRASVRNLSWGLGGGVGAACLVLAVPLAVGAAEFHPVGDGEAYIPTIVFVSVVLLFGAVGEEMLFRGYGFQVLIAAVGPLATIIPVSVLFGLAHAGNPEVSRLGLLNTMLWGALLGWSFWRSGDLWLPIGLHLGWNWTLPLFGANLSGFTMRVTGYEMHWKTGPLWSGGDYGPEGGILTCGALAVLFLYLWKAPIRRQSPFLLHSRREA